MSFTYDITTDLGRVRRTIGDVTQASARFTDGELQYWLDSEGTVNLAAAAACDALAALAADEAGSERIGDYQYDKSSKGDKWLALASELRARGAAAPSFASCRPTEAGSAVR